MDVCCCLCRDPVAGDHQKRKKLYGAACKKARTVLTEEFCVSLEALVETKDPEAVVCSSCETALNNIRRLTDKVEALKAGVREKLAGLRSVVVFVSNI